MEYLIERNVLIIKYLFEFQKMKNKHLNISTERENEIMAMVEKHFVKYNDVFKRLAEGPKGTREEMEKAARIFKENEVYYRAYAKRKGILNSEIEQRLNVWFEEFEEVLKQLSTD